MSHLLSNSTWVRLLNAADLDDLLRLLDSTDYRKSLQSLDVTDITPDQVEHSLRAYLTRSLRVPLKLLQGQSRDLLDWLWRRFELENLKTVVRSVARHVPARHVQSMLIPLGSASTLPWQHLVRVTSVPAIADTLRSTFHGQIYAGALDQAMGRYQREGSIFALEVSLDLTYYRRLLRLMATLSGRDQQDAARFVGMRIDGQNLLWALRYRDFFDLSAEEILSYTLQRKLRVDAAVVRSIAQGARLSDILVDVWRDRLPDLDRVRDLPVREALPQLEQLFQRYRYQQALSRLQGYPFHLGTFLAYEVLLESEIHDLIVLVEGKAAGLAGADLQPYLIGSRG